MAAGDAHVFPDVLTLVLTQLSFHSHRLLFSHASAEVRGENMLERDKLCVSLSSHWCSKTGPQRVT